MPEYNLAMANTFCSLKIHCIFSSKERALMLNPELRERLWPFLGGIAKQNGITPRCIGGGCRPRSSAAVMANHSSHRQSHSIMTSIVPPGRGPLCIATQALRAGLRSQRPSGTLATVSSNSGGLLPEKKRRKRGRGRVRVRLRN
jgi:hypothetical protein